MFSQGKMPYFLKVFKTFLQRDQSHYQRNCYERALQVSG